MNNIIRFNNINLFASIIFFTIILFPDLSAAQDKDSTQVHENLLQISDTNNVNLNSSVSSDSLFSADSIKVIAKRDSLIPLKITGFSLRKKIKIDISKKQIYKSDYRYTGDLFTNLPFGFLEDLGSLGQPNEVMIYGLGFGNISYLNNGIPLNNRLLNSFDLNFFQSESIDSLEIMPITKGFLYSLNNNSVTVNFITRDKVDKIPYSRLRYYQAADKEGYLDGFFNFHLFSKINFSVNFTNSSIGSRYANSEYSGWKVSSVLKYMPSNKLNIIGEYRYQKSTAGLNGGVDFQKITNNNQPAEINTILYDPFQAPMKYGEQMKDSPRYQKTTGHNFRINLLAHLIKSMPSSINLYYQFNQVEFRQNENKNLTDIPFIFHNNMFYSGGGTFRQLIKSNWFTADLIGAYDQTVYTSPLLKYNDTKQTFSASGSVNFLLIDKKVVPSIFAKYMNYSENSFKGIGAGLSFTISDNLQSNFSVSQFSKPYSILEEQYLSNNSTKQNILAAQAILKYKSTNINGLLGYFYYNNDASPLPVIDNYSDSLNISEIGFYKTEKMIQQGMNLKTDITFSNILISTNLSYYFGNNNYRNIPEFSLTGGVYYVDTLFKSNLKLKTGITVYFTGKQNYFQYDFEKSTATVFYKPFGANTTQLISSSSTKPAVQLDYFLAGKIKDAAIVYFVFQNLLNTQYYIVPYYPKQSRGIRFGVSWELYN